MSGLLGVQSRRPVDTSALSDREMLLLSGLETKVAMGWCELLLGSLDLMDPVRTRGSDVAKDWLRAIEVHVGSMVATEKEHGDGCLLDLDHPRVRNFLSRRTMDGSPFISEGQVAAARRFQATARTAA